MSGSLEPGSTRLISPRRLPAPADPSRLPPRPIGSSLAGASIGSRLAGAPGEAHVAGAPTGPRGRPALEPNATIVARTDVSSSVARFVVLPDASPGPFGAGQYLALGVAIDGRLVRRPYSSASAPTGDATHEFLVRLVPAGSLTPALWQASPGTRVWLGRPKGDFVLDPADDRTHLFIASGTGLAPFVSMSRALAERTSPPSVVLLHGVATPADLAFGAELRTLAEAGLPLALEPTVSRPADPASVGWGGRTGRAEEALRAVLADHRLRPGGTVAYLCGNPGMVAAASTVLAEAGFPATDVRAERYWVAGAGTPGREGATTGAGTSSSADASAIASPSAASSAGASSRAGAAA